MASSKKSCFILFFISSLFIHASIAEVICENLPENLCAFAVATSGKRCALESFKGEGARGTCTTSEVMAAEGLADHIESDRCVAACGVDCRSVGIYTDGLMTPNFIYSLCSSPCYDNCPNIVNLYSNLVADSSSVILPEVCEELESFLMSPF